MNIRCTPAAIAAAALTVAAALAPTANAAPIYGGPTYDSSTSTGFQNPALPVAPGSTAGNGTAVGYADKYTGGTSLGARAVRWDASGTAATELGNLGTNSGGSTTSIAYAVNTAGTAVGYAEKYSGSTYLGTRAVRWDAGGTTATELGNLGTNSSGITGNYAYAVNTAGTAVGQAQKYTGGTNLGYRAVRWDASGTAATELGNLGTDSSGVTLSNATAVNTAGTAVGYAQKYTGDTPLGNRAVRWDASGTAATELGNLGTTSGGSTDGRAYAVNTAGTAVGQAQKYNAGTYVGTRAVRWDASGTAATELGNLGTDSSGVTFSNANAVNTAGTAVGSAFKYTAGTYVGNRAVFWGLDAVAVDLNTLLSPADAALWTLTEAHGISDTNWITGIGTYDPDGAGGLQA